MVFNLIYGSKISNSHPYFASELFLKTLINENISNEVASILLLFGIDDNLEELMGNLNIESINNRNISFNNEEGETLNLFSLLQENRRMLKNIRDTDIPTTSAKFEEFMNSKNKITSLKKLVLSNVRKYANLCDNQELRKVLMPEKIFNDKIIQLSYSVEDVGSSFSRYIVHLIRKYNIDITFSETDNEETILKNIIYDVINNSRDYRIICGILNYYVKTTNKKLNLPFDDIIGYISDSDPKATRFVLNIMDNYAGRNYKLKNAIAKFVRNKKFFNCTPTEEILEEIIKRTDANYLGANYANALFSSCLNEDFCTIRQLLKKGANPFAIVNNKTIFDYAFENRKFSIIRTFIDEKAVEPQIVLAVLLNNYMLITQDKIRCDFIELTNYLVNKGAKLNEVYNNQRTIDYLGDPELKQYLINFFQKNEKERADELDSMRDDVIRSIIERNNMIDIFGELKYEKTANIFTEIRDRFLREKFKIPDDEDLKTALEDIVKTLVNMGVELNMTNGNDILNIIAAKLDPNWDLVERATRMTDNYQDILLERAKNIVEDRGLRYITFDSRIDNLLIYLRDNNLEMLEKKLLELLDDPNFDINSVISKEGDTLINLFCKESKLTYKIADLLLKRGANPNIVDNKGNTALNNTLMYNNYFNNNPRNYYFINLLVNASDPTIKII